MTKRSTRRLGARLLSALIAAAALGGCSAAPAAPSAAVKSPAARTAAPAAHAQQVESVRAMTWNMCGESGGDLPAVGSPSPAYCPFRAQPAVKMAEVATLARMLDLNAVMLQEICSGAPGSHLDLLEHDLGPGWSFVWAPTSRDDGRSDCRDGLAGTYSTAIGIRGRISAVVDRTPLPVPDGFERSRILCVSVAGWQSVVCTTQLDNEDQLPAATYAAEVQAVRRTLLRYPWIVLGGDFNTQVAAKLSALYGVAPECDQRPYQPGEAVNAPTQSSWDPSRSDPGRYDQVKLDYLFARSGFTDCGTRLDLTDQANYASTSHPTGLSDHAPLYGYTRGGPRVDWRFAAARGASVPDASGHGFAGVLSGGASPRPDHGGAVDISGAGAVSSAKPLIQTDRSFSASAWVEPARGSGTMAVLGQAGGLASGCYLRFSTDTGAWTFGMTSADSAAAGADQAVGPADAASGGWTFITGVYDSITGSLSLYVDGRLAAGATHPHRWSAEGAFTVGRDQVNGNPADQWTGEIADVAVFDYTLTPAEVAAAYESGLR